MRIHKKIGTKGRLFEMFENVNKVKLDEAYDESYVDPIAAARTAGEESNRNHEFSRLSANNFQVFKDEYGIPDDIFNKMSDDQRRQELVDYLSIGESVKTLKEEQSTEVGSDSGIVQMLVSYVSNNYLSEEEFTIGDLTVIVEAQPTTWDDVPYRAATRMQPEEGGYPENVQGELTNITVWDREDNEYRLSQEAFAKVNQHVRGFDGRLHDELAEKAANGGEDEYSRADFARDDALTRESNEPLPIESGKDGDLGGMKYKTTRQYTTNSLFPRGEEPTNRKERRSAGLGGRFSKDIKNKLREEETENVAQQIYDELEMRYSPTTRTISHDEIIDVANLYGAQPEDVAQVASEVITNAIDITVDVEDFVQNLQANNFDYNKPTVTMWEMFEKEYQEGSTFGEFRNIWDKLTKDPNQKSMFETSYTDLARKSGVDKMEGIRFNYDQRGNWIPVGYEDKKVALRPLEQPLGSDNWKVAVVGIEDDGNLGDIYATKDTWEEAKNALYDSIN